jgi:hypothetical protein
MNMLQGRKTYIVALVMIIYGVAGVLLGKLGTNDAYELILQALGFAALRNGVGNKS